jgi:hypothetical protein
MGVRPAMSFDMTGRTVAYLGRHGAARAVLLAAALGTTMAMAMVQPAQAGGTRAHLGGHPGVSVTARPPVGVDVPGFVARANASAMAAGSEACFGSQLEQAPGGDELARSTVFLYIVSPDGKRVANGSAFVVADSATPQDGANKMITAAHVPDILERPDFKGGQLLAINSSGRILGEARAVAHSSKAYDMNGHMARKGDIATLSLLPLDADGAAAYAKIGGLRLAPQQADSYIPGYFGSPDTPGVWHGNSGGPAIDGQGAVVGVVSNIMAPDGVSNVGARTMPGKGPGWSVTLTSQNVLAASGKATVATSAQLPQFDIGWIHPLGDPAILASLGHAGTGVQETPQAPSLTGNVHAWAAGYPAMGQCRASEARIGWGSQPIYVPGNTRLSVALANVNAAADAANVEWVRPVEEEWVRPVP